MAAYAYDDYRVTFTPRRRRAYDVRAVDAAGASLAGAFRVPFSDDELAGAVAGRGRPRSRRHDRVTSAAAERRRRSDAERLGAALAAALLAGPIGDGLRGRPAPPRRRSGAGCGSRCRSPPRRRC